MKEMADVMEGTKVQGRDKSLANKQVTFVVYREGDQLNFFRVVDRGDGTLTPLSETMRSAFSHNIYSCFKFVSLSNRSGPYCLKIQIRVCHLGTI